MKLKNILVYSTLSVVLLVGLGGCSSSDDDDGIGPVAQSFSGTFITLGGSSGTVQLMRVSPVTSSGLGVMAAVVDVTGSITPAGGVPVDISGTIDDQSSFFMASGGGYFLSGFFDAGLIGGNLSGPLGSGVFGTLGSGSGTAQNYCGDWIETGQPMPGGLVSLTVLGNQAVANVVDFANAESIQLTNNTVSGSSVSLAAFAGQDIDLQASGTLSGGMVSGTWTSLDSGGGAIGGTWQGTTQGCN